MIYEMAEVIKKTPKPTVHGHKIYEFILKQLTPMQLNTSIYLKRYFLFLFINEPISVFFITNIFINTFEKLTLSTSSSHTFPFPTSTFSSLLSKKYLATIFSTNNDKIPNKQYTNETDRLTGLIYVAFICYETNFSILTDQML